MIENTKLTVHHWRYEDGWENMPYGLRDKTGMSTNDRMFDKDSVGWHCWVYPPPGTDFAEWMLQNMKGRYRCDTKFNSGKFVILVMIADSEDATMFKLRWVCEN